MLEFSVSLSLQITLLIKLLFAQPNFWSGKQLINGPGSGLVNHLCKERNTVRITDSDPLQEGPALNFMKFVRTLYWRLEKWHVICLHVASLELNVLQIFDGSEVGLPRLVD